MRIISTVPSQTELLFDLGLNNEIVGITKFCIHPKEYTSSKVKIGGTKNLNIEKILSLNPSLIIGNKEENVKSQFDLLSNHSLTHITDIKNLEDNIQLVKEIGELTHKDKEAQYIINQFKGLFQNNKSKDTLSCLYLIWKKPYMSVGGDTYISNVLSFYGFKNVLKNKERYPEISIEEIIDLNPDFIFLSSEPYPFKEKDVLELKKDINSKIILVDGEAFSWYGTRFLKKQEYLNNLKVKLDSLV